MYGATTDFERSPGEQLPGVPARENAAENIDANCLGIPASDVPESAGRKPAIDPAIAFLDGFGVSRRALDLASRLAVIRGTGAHDELIAAGVLSADDYWAFLAAYLGLPFVTGEDALAMLPAARIVPSEALRRSDRLLVMDDGEPLLLLAPAGAMLSRLCGSVERAPPIAHRIRIATPETIRAVLLRRHAGHYVACAVQRLHRASVASSAFGPPVRWSHR